MIVHNTQKVWFDGRMMPVEEYATVMLESGRSVDYVLRRIGFMLGFEALHVPDTSADRYACTFECIIERMPKRESICIS